MAKIDVSGIEGYADMCAEDKVKALLPYVSKRAGKIIINKIKGKDK